MTPDKSSVSIANCRRALVVRWGFFFSFTLGSSKFKNLVCSGPVCDESPAPDCIEEVDGRGSVVVKTATSRDQDIMESMEIQTETKTFDIKEK